VWVAGVLRRGVEVLREEGEGEGEGLWVVEEEVEGGGGECIDVAGEEGKMGGGLLYGVDHGHDRMRSRYGFAGRAARRNKEMISGLGYLLSMESLSTYWVAKCRDADVGL